MFILLPNIYLGQHIILKGFVEGINDEKLAYVNIGIKNIGTISDENGNLSVTKGTKIAIYVKVRQ
ncbi:hypothetical protein [Polaribacter porphyrae]|uniref:hypothetical protein n=1 Tax=Polaribacter porphyrae TaxID=1137780 RepID=UPI0011B09F96|nr:hypothetical protein [Polaribacter porphyrae]